MPTQLQIRDFLNAGFKSFSTYDCVINIPSLVDGFKISQRKAMYVISKRDRMNTVERYSSEVATATAYHHGANNLESVIVGMAQDFPTSNNVNFLTPDGQFGNILNHLASAARYISVEPNAAFRKWFKKEDDLIIEYETEDGEQIEPKFFIPVVPTILFNGTSGIGTGYSCKILAYNPADIIKSVQAVLDGKKQKKLTPWYRGYTGTVSKQLNQTTFTGVFKRVNTTTIKVTALPVGYDLDQYLATLSKLIEKGTIKDYDDNSTETGFDIDIYVTREFSSSYNDDEITSVLGLVSRDSENIVVWGEDGKIHQFENPELLIEYFVKIRLAYYEKRRLKLIQLTTERISWLSEKARFIQFYLNNVNVFRTKKKPELVEVLVKNKFVEHDKLLQMPILNLTKDKIDELNAEIAEDNKYLATLKKDDAESMYRRELAAL